VLLARVPGSQLQVQTDSVETRIGTNELDLISEELRKPPFTRLSVPISSPRDGPCQSVLGGWPGLALVTHTRLASGSIAYQTRPAPVTSSCHCSSAWPLTSREPRSPRRRCWRRGLVGVCGRSRKVS